MSKHIKEILDLFRGNYRNIKAVLSEYSSFRDLKVLDHNLYPNTPNDNVFVLSNDKAIKAEELDFSEVKDVNGNPVVFLGDYRFYFKDNTFNM